MPRPGWLGSIKAVLALEHRLVPARRIHFDAPNPDIDFATSPFYVNAALQSWETASTPRRAGVNSLGIGGTNAHVVLEEAPPIVDPNPSSRPSQLLLLSARTPAALDRTSASIAEHLASKTDVQLEDVAYTLHVGRQQFRHRRAAVCHTVAEAALALGSRTQAG